MERQTQQRLGIGCIIAPWAIVALSFLGMLVFHLLPNLLGVTNDAALFIFSTITGLFSMLTFVGGLGFFPLTIAGIIVLVMAPKKGQSDK